MNDGARVCIRMDSPPAENKSPESGPPVATNGSGVPLRDKLFRQLDGIQETTAACLLVLNEVRQQDQLIADLQRQNGQYREQFHERETLRPIWLMLIGVLDRSRDQERELDQLLQAARDRELAATLRRLKDTRRADSTEVEAALAGFGVTAFRHTGAQFEARCQQCRRRIPCDNPELHERITHRVAPGYRRNDWIVRPEQVDVLVCNKA